MISKLGIDELNDMQKEVQKHLKDHSQLLLLSPTGSGKTLAFLLPVIERLDPQIHGIQALIIVPSRELAIQIEQVARDLGSGFKVNAVYGGRAGAKDRMEIKHPPAILIATPGRAADHIRKESIQTDEIAHLVLDEFDKSLEMGFEDEMESIFSALPSLATKILTSATQKVKIPDFVRFKNAKRLNFSQKGETGLEIKIISSKEEEKQKNLNRLLHSLADKNGIIFCNFKDSIAELSDFLKDRKWDHATFHGGLEQLEREQSLIKFRNGSVHLLLASDLAARGIDVPEMDFIIHYELPPRPDEFIHRNGRTARMNASGTAFVFDLEGEESASFIKGVRSKIESKRKNSAPLMKTLYISGGRKDKISKGDIAGLFFKEGKLKKEELGIIELKQNGAYVAVHAEKAKELVHQLNNSRLKKKKVRISLLK